MSTSETDVTWAAVSIEARMLRAIILRTVPSWEVSSTPHELAPLAAAAAGAGVGAGAARGGRRGSRRSGSRRCDDRGGRGDLRSGGRGAVTLLQVLLDVLLGHASAAAGAGDLRDVERVLGDHACDDRRHEAASLAVAVRVGIVVRRRLGRGRRRCGRRRRDLARRCGLGGRCRRGGRLRCGGCRGCLRRAAGSAVPASPEVITAMRVPTSTVSPSATRISETMPLPGDGTSVSTLSVEISTIVSSASTRSPTCFRQRVIVPSDTLTPIWGITTSTAVPVLTAGGPR